MTDGTALTDFGDLADSAFLPDKGSGGRIVLTTSTAGGRRSQAVEQATAFRDFTTPS